MRHARADYNRIQDPAGKIPDDEPVFLIRAQDFVSGATVREWAHLNAKFGGDDELTALAMEQAERMDAWPKKKLADK